MYKHEQHHITPSSEGHKNDIQRLNCWESLHELRANGKELKSKPQARLCKTKANYPFYLYKFHVRHFLPQTGYRSIKFGIEALFQARELGIYARELGIHARKLGVHVLAQIADFAAHISKALFHVATYIYNILFRRNV